MFKSFNSDFNLLILILLYIVFGIGPPLPQLRFFLLLSTPLYPTVLLYLLPSLSTNAKLLYSTLPSSKLKWKCGPVLAADS